MDNKIFMLGGYNRVGYDSMTYADVLQWEPNSPGWKKVGEMLEPTDSLAVSPIELNEKLLEICR